MKAVCWHGPGDVRVEQVPDPRIADAGDAILRITTTAICGSDLHLYNGVMPTMQPGDVLGHENMGEVVDVGPGVTRLRVGDRVVVPFCIACGSCWFCQQGLFAACDTTNPNAEMARKAMGHSPAAMFGYSHLTGGYAGGQAEYLRVPHADVGALKIPDGVPDERVVFLSDIFPTGYMAAENADINQGDTIAIWGCGPVGQFAIQSAWMLGAGRVIAIDRVPERLKMAREQGRAETIDFSQHNVYDTLQEMTRGRGPDGCIDAVGCEAHATGTMDAVYDKVKHSLMMTTDRSHTLREAIMCCRKAGTISVPGVYVGFPDKIPMGAFMNKGLTMKSGQTHMHRYLQPLLDRVMRDEIDPSFVITHRVPLDDVPEMYRTFQDKQDGCIKVVIQP